MSSERVKTDESTLPLERRLFFRYARYHLPEMRLNFRGGRLSPKDGDWNNVIDHQVMQLAEADVMSDTLGMSEDERGGLLTAALCHDWKKRLEKRSEDFTPEQKVQAEEFLKRAAPNAELMDATETGFSKKIIDGDATFLQRLMFYIDNITLESKIVPLNKRIAETEARTALNEDEEWTQRLGGRYWDVERMAAWGVEQELFTLLKKRGAAISVPHDVPFFIRAKVGELVGRKLDTERKEPRFSVTLLSESQIESGNRRNEDTCVVAENDAVMVAAVLDGASALSAVTTVAHANLRGGRFAAQWAAVGIEKNFATTVSTQELLLAANQQIRNALESQHMDVEMTPPLELSAATATVVRIDKEKHIVQIAQAGDTACIVEKRDGIIELAIPPDTQVGDDEVLKRAVGIAKQKGISVKEALNDPDLAQIMVDGRLLNNAPNKKGQGVLNGSKNLEPYIQTAEYALSDVVRIVLLTDGMFIPHDLEENERWDKVIEIVKDKGLDGLYESISHTKRLDPDLNTYPRFKQYDDATGIVIEV